MVSFTKYFFFFFKNARQVITRNQLAMINVSHVPLTVCQVTLMFPAPARVASTGRPKMQSVDAQVTFTIF